MVMVRIFTFFTSFYNHVLLSFSHKIDIFHWQGCCRPEAVNVIFRVKNTEKFKGTDTICFSISFYNVNQKPMSSKTNVHCEPTRSACSSG